MTLETSSIFSGEMPFSSLKTGGLRYLEYADYLYLLSKESIIIKHCPEADLSIFPRGNPTFDDYAGLITLAKKAGLRV